MARVRQLHVPPSREKHVRAGKIIGLRVVRLAVGHSVLAQVQADPAARLRDRARRRGVEALVGRRQVDHELALSRRLCHDAPLGAAGRAIAGFGDWPPHGLPNQNRILCLSLDFVLTPRGPNALQRKGVMAVNGHDHRRALGMPAVADLLAGGLGDGRRQRSGQSQENCDDGSGEAITHKTTCHGGKLACWVGSYTAMLGWQLHRHVGLAVALPTLLCRNSWAAVQLPTQQLAVILSAAKNLPLICGEILRCAQDDLCRPQDDLGGSAQVTLWQHLKAGWHRVGPATTGRGVDACPSTRYACFGRSSTYHAAGPGNLSFRYAWPPTPAACP